MATKTEERLKILLKEYIEEKEYKLENELINRLIGIFLWGFILGCLFTYTSLMPLSIGMILGFSLAKKNIPFVNIILFRVLEFIEKGQKYMIRQQDNNDKKVE